MIKWIYCNIIFKPVATVLYILYIICYGGLFLPFALGRIHNKSMTLMVFKLPLWWATWLMAFFWLVVSTIFFVNRYFFELAASEDQHASAVLGLNKDLTISNYIGVAMRVNRATKGMIKFDEALSWFDKSEGSHSVNSIGQ